MLNANKNTKKLQAVTVNLVLMYISVVWLRKSHKLNKTLVDLV